MSGEVPASSRVHLNAAPDVENTSNRNAGFSRQEAGHGERPPYECGVPEDLSRAVPSRIEQLFELAVSSKLLLIGRETLRRNKSHLHFVLIATDIIASHRAEVLADFKHYPVVQHFTAADFVRLFQIEGAKTVGFAKSELAKSIYAELKPHRINEPLHPSKSGK